MFVLQLEIYSVFSKLISCTEESVEVDFFHNILQKPHTELNQHNRTIPIFDKL